MLRIHHVPTTRGFRIIRLCEELRVPCEIVPVDFSSQYRASAERRAMNPVGKVPVMTDGSLTMFESGTMALMRAGRARGRIENEIFNPLKTRDYNIGHGNRHLATVFAYPMMLAMLIDQIQQARRCAVSQGAGQGRAPRAIVGTRCGGCS